MTRGDGLWSAIGTVGVAALGIACATAMPHPAVQRARQEVRAVELDPKIRQNASVQVYEARRALTELESAASDDAGAAELEHLAYLTTRRTEVARAVADRVMLQDRLQVLAEERDRLRLEARTREAASARVRAQTAEERLRELESELRTIETSRDERGLVLTLGDILFDFDRAELRSGAERTLDRVAEFLNEYPGRRVEIEGHTDGLGDETYNRWLSERRAQAVADYLMSRGVAPRRVSTRGLGESAPVASNATDEGRQQNRRVEVILPN